MKKKLILIFLTSLLSWISLLEVMKFPYALKNSTKNSKIIEIPQGSSIKNAGKILEKNDLIIHELLFRIAARLKKITAIPSGEFEINRQMNILQILQKIANGEFYDRKISFAEGITLHSIIEKINQNEFLGGNLEFIKENEGQYLPETYHFFKGHSKEFILKQMAKDMQKTLDDAWHNRQSDLPLKDKYELLILASIVEKETSVESERENVAAVFVNRLKKNMPLQADPTIIYGKNFGDQNLDVAITRSDLKRQTPYNSYLNKHLPPTPICSPGAKSIYAAANPANVKYLYFVAKGDGGHNFSENLQEHNRFVKKFRQFIKKLKGAKNDN